MENRIFEDRIDKLEQCKDKHDDRLDKIEKQVIEISIGYRKDIDIMQTWIREIKIGQEKLLSEIESLKMKPAKRWDDTTSKALSVIVGAVVTYIMVQVGLL